MSGTALFLEIQYQLGCVTKEQLLLIVGKKITHEEYETIISSEETP